MKYLAIFILMSFVGLLTVGFTTMPHESHHGKADCVIAAYDAACTTEASNMALHHVGAYISFLNILVSIIALFSIAIVFLWNVSFPQLKLQPIPIDPRIKVESPKRREFLRWLSLFINSPSFK